MTSPALKWARKRHVDREPVDIFARLLEQDAELGKHRFPLISPWWRGTLDHLYRRARSCGCHRLVARVGRRGGKSSTLTRVACVEVLHGRWRIPPGDVGVWCFFSVKTGEAENRLDTLDAILHTIGLREGDDYKASSDKLGRYVELAEKPLMWRALPASFRTAVGFTSVGGLADELARWRDERTGANPASHVLETWRPAMATQMAYGAKELQCSSPWSTVDAHYEHFERGTGDTQLVAYAPTWEANPTLTEYDCSQLAEKDSEDFEREYRAVPMPFSELAMFDPRAIEQAVTTEPYELELGDMVVAGADMGFRRDSSALVICALDPAGHYHVLRMLELTPTRDAPLRPSYVCEQFSLELDKYGCNVMMADAHYRQSVEEHLQEHGIALIDAPTDVAGTYVRFRTLLHQGKLHIPDDGTLRKDLERVQSAPTSTGRLRVILPRSAGRHADTVAALVLSTWQEGGHLIQEEVEDRRSGWSDEERDMYQEALGGRRGCRIDVGDIAGESYIDHSQTWLGPAGSEET